MENTRVFVSGIPPTLSNEDLGKHFSSRFHVTDSHVIPNRRIGFVGFKNAEIAKEAAKYFNKTFLRMSKISVEIARPAGESKPTKNRTHSDHDSTSNASNLKRKRDETSKDDPKLQEFLNVMQHSSKTRTWANDDIISAAPTIIDSSEPAIVKTNDASQDKPSRPVKKSKMDEVETPRPASKTPAVPAAQGGDEAQHQDDNADKEASAEEDQPKSDMDWLRSKTSRLLGLLDEEEETASGPQPPASASSTVEPIEEDSDEVEEAPVAEEPAEEKDYNADIELIRISGRLFLRNLAYDATEADLETLFAPFGKIDEIHVAFDTRTTSSKGFAYIQYVDPSSAIDAYKNLDGKDFQGRLLHILPASAKKSYKIDEYELSKLPLKKQRQVKRRMEASSSTFNWNSLYMNSDAVMSSIADRLGVSKSDLLDPTSSDAAVKQAHAETHVIQETKAYFTANGVNIDSFKQRERGTTTILVKNFSYGVKVADLRKLFEPFGQLTRLLMPPSGTIAIVEFAKPDEASKAFKGLAYRKLGDSILFLERAPKDLFESPPTGSALISGVEGPQAKDQGFSAADTFAAEDNEPQLPTSTLFVRNLNFSTTSARLTEVFSSLDGFLTAKVKTKTDPKRPGETLSMGFGFVEFRTKEQAQAALAVMDGYTLDQHKLVVKTSHRGMDAAETRRQEDNAKKVAARRTKIIIKNLPFQATKHDVRSLFGAYGQLRSVRVPKKFDRSARGFAFADFVSSREAENAMDALKNTHLLGRKLVLEYASAEAIDAEEEIRKIEKKTGQQLDRQKLQSLTGTGRKKFVVGAAEDEG
ncbi:pre-rRNA processing protein Mrd1, putative [Talaromyces stipitatus ATCC 10500]|uniref:Multiple RNA-binding domain-containing protein 1 n=1 Tax=Talaromyces stipitatus (strain ATCC 10500 / CBS 375.48 / QM 6759 / NRRL 1006) TaxID=441959 RepID=B8MH05_TALSN|nr:pre-rRNA processing protein Mrd1, putative [Talaromyces stipitatus ATCC 10500]EED16819.1 pre-rRNA processing protein Mrd1, putative [Talaromyces stipitatus ATCC 10500]